MTTTRKMTMMRKTLMEIKDINNQAAVYLLDSITTPANPDSFRTLSTAIRTLKTALNLSRTLYTTNTNTNTNTNTTTTTEEVVAPSSSPSSSFRTNDHHHHEEELNDGNNNNNTTNTNTNSSSSVFKFHFLGLPSSTSSSSSTTSTTTMQQQQLQVPGEEEGSNSTSKACYSYCFINQSCCSSRMSFLFVSPIVLTTTTTTTSSRSSSSPQQIAKSSEEELLHMVSSIMIYNLALAYHLLAVRCINIEHNIRRGQFLFQTSSSLYEKALKMIFPSMIYQDHVVNVNDYGGQLKIMKNSHHSTNDNDNNDNDDDDDDDGGNKAESEEEEEESSESNSNWISSSLYLMAILFNQGHANDAIGNNVQSEVLYEQLSNYISSCKQETTTQPSLLLDVFLYNISFHYDIYNNRYYALAA